MKPTYQHLSLNQAESLLSGRELDRYHFLWCWSTPRWSHPWEISQSRYIDRHGMAHFHARINQVRRLLGLKEYPFSYKD